MTNAVSDDKAQGAFDSVFQSGAIARVMIEPRSGLAKRAELVKILHVLDGTALVQPISGKSLPRYVPIRRLQLRLSPSDALINSEAYTPNPLPTRNADPAGSDATLADIAPPLLKEGWWCVSVDGRRPWVGVIREPGRDSTIVQQFSAIDGSFLPMWELADFTTTTSKIAPASS